MGKKAITAKEGQDKNNKKPARPRLLKKSLKKQPLTRPKAKKALKAPFSTKKKGDIQVSSKTVSENETGSNDYKILVKQGSKEFETNEAHGSNQAGFFLKDVKREKFNFAKLQTDYLTTILHCLTKVVSSYMGLEFMKNAVEIQAGFVGRSFIITTNNKKTSEELSKKLAKMSLREITNEIIKKGEKEVSTDVFTAAKILQNSSRNTINEHMKTHKDRSALGASAYLSLMTNFEKKFIGDNNAEGLKNKIIENAEKNNIEDARNRYVLINPSQDDHAEGPINTLMKSVVEEMKKKKVGIKIPQQAVGIKLPCLICKSKVDVRSGEYLTQVDDYNNVYGNLFPSQILNVTATEEIEKIIGNFNKAGGKHKFGNNSTNVDTDLIKRDSVDQNKFNEDYNDLNLKKMETDEFIGELYKDLNPLRKRKTIKGDSVSDGLYKDDIYYNLINLDDCINYIDLTSNVDWSDDLVEKSVDTSILGVSNDNGNHHAVCMAKVQNNKGGYDILIIDPLGKDSPFKDKLEEIKNVLQIENNKVDVVYSGLQAESSAVCADISLILAKQINALKSKDYLDKPEEYKKACLDEVEKLRNEMYPDKKQETSVASTKTDNNMGSRNSSSIANTEASNKRESFVEKYASKSAIGEQKMTFAEKHALIDKNNKLFVDKYATKPTKSYQGIS